MFGGTVIMGVTPRSELSTPISFSRIPASTDRFSLGGMDNEVGYQACHRCKPVSIVGSFHRFTTVVARVLTVEPTITLRLCLLITRPSTHADRL